MSTETAPEQHDAATAVSTKLESPSARDEQQRPALDEERLTMDMCEAIREADEQRLFKLLTQACERLGTDVAINTYAPRVKALLKVKYRIDDVVGVEDMNGDTCMHYAAGAGHSIVLRFFYNAGLLKHIDQYFNREGDTPLHDAVRKRQVMMVKQLIFLGSGRSVANRRGETPLSLAKKSGDRELLAAVKMDMAPAAACPRR